MSIHWSASSTSATSEAGGGPPPSTLARLCAAYAILYLGAVTLGFALFAAAMKFGLLAGVDILFYRGVAVLVPVFAASLLPVSLLAGRLRAWGLMRRDAPSACVLALSFNLCFLIVLPVTIDRSVSVFMLGEMAAHPGETYSPARMRDAFEQVYVGDFRQIERRLAEQETSGNVARAGDGYAITAQGREFVRLSGLIAWLFGVDPRFVERRRDAWALRGTSEGAIPCCTER